MAQTAGMLREEMGQRNKDEKRRTPQAPAEGAGVKTKGFPQISGKGGLWGVMLGKAAYSTQEKSNLIPTSRLNTKTLKDQCSFWKL